MISVKRSGHNAEGSGCGIIDDENAATNHEALRKNDKKRF
jgi:hypothetical protein